MMKRTQPLRFLLPLSLMLFALCTSGFAGASFKPAVGPAIRMDHSGASLLFSGPGPGLADAAATLPLPCQSTQAAKRCYTPAQIATAYGAAPLFKQGVDGRDQSIAIIGASSDPSLAADLHVFDQAFGLPDPALNISYVHCDITQWTCQPGSPGSPNPANSVETSIDVEWSHALAPQATVNLILVDSSDATTAEQVLEYIVSTAGYAIDKHLGEVVSLSVGFAEQCSPPAFLAFEHGIFEKAKEKAITVAASAGDTGSTQYTCDVKSFFTSPVVATPASDPLVLAVGGSHLVAGSDGTYQSETAWTQVSVKHNNGAGGGGFSSIFSLPGYQRGITTGSMRGIPDVSVDADPNSGYIVECSFCNNNHRVFFRIGGTSVSAPVWAGIIALADQMAGHSLGFVNPALYAIAQASSRGQAFHDIVGGNNSYSFINSGGLVETVPGYKAVAGWDAATGLGSPNAVGLLPLLVTMTP